MLTDRKSEILRLIVRDYIREVTPVASETIARKHGLGVSPATIRNDVADLEHEGYITRPHPSAGSIPLDSGYRVYVEDMAGHGTADIPRSVRVSVQKRLLEVARDIDEWTNVAAELLAHMAGNLAIVTFPKASESRVKRVELVRLQDFLTLLIVVFQQARLRKQLIHLTEPVTSSDLQMSANRVTDMLVGLSSREIEAKDLSLSPFEKEVVDTTVVMQKDEDRPSYPDHYLDGLRNLLAQPEYADKERVQEVVESVEDGSLAQAVLDETPDSPVVRVVIGQENQGDMLRPLSVVISRYGIPGEAAGAVGAIGPVRMQYSVAIEGVQLMGQIMTSLVESVHGD